MIRSEFIRRYWKFNRFGRWATRTVFCIALPFILIAAYASRFWYEFKSCCWHTRQDGRIEIENFRAYMRDMQTKPTKESK